MHRALHLHADFAHPRRKAGRGFGGHHRRAGLHRALGAKHLQARLAGLREMHRSLEVGGLLMFSTFGPDTLKELRACFSDGYEHTLRFVDMHDYGDMLIECGFTDPVMDAERLTVTYPSPAALFSELRRSGSACATGGRRRGLMGRQAWQAVCSVYEKLRVEGRLPATLEVVYGHAWKAEPRTIADGRAVIRFDPKQRLSPLGDEGAISGGDSMRGSIGFG